MSPSLQVIFAVEISVRRKDCLPCRSNGSCRLVLCRHPSHIPAPCGGAAFNALRASLSPGQTIILFCWVVNIQLLISPFEFTQPKTALGRCGVKLPCNDSESRAAERRGGDEFYFQLAGGSVVLGCHLALQGCFLRCKMEPLPTCSPRAEFCTLASCSRLSLLCCALAGSTRACLWQLMGSEWPGFIGTWHLGREWAACSPNASLLLPHPRMAQI